MVLEIKSIGCIEGLRKVPELFGLEKSMLEQFSPHKMTCFDFLSSINKLCF